MQPQLKTLTETEIIVEILMLVREEPDDKEFRVIAVWERPRTYEGVADERFLEFVDLSAVLVGEKQAAQLDIVPIAVESSLGEVLFHVAVSHRYRAPLS